MPCARLSWPYRQLLSARKYTVSYCIQHDVRNTAHRACLSVATVYDSIVALCATQLPGGHNGLPAECTESSREVIW